MGGEGILAGMPVVSPRVLVALPAAVIGVVAAAVLAFVLPLLLAIPAALVAGGIVAAVLWFASTPIALRHLKAVPLSEGQAPRLESVVESICAHSGIVEPELHMVDAETIDAAVAGSSRHTHLVVTRGLLERLDRLEHEAVVARELAQFGSGIQAATVLVGASRALGPFGPLLRSRVVDDRRLARADIDGVLLTRYPPALASVFDKASAVGRVADVPACRHLWMIGPDAAEAQLPLVQRADALREL